MSYAICRNTDGYVWAIVPDVPVADDVASDQFVVDFGTSFAPGDHLKYHIVVRQVDSQGKIVEYSVVQMGLV